jgi:ParB family chromosome partitioning protein
MNPPYAQPLVGQFIDKLVGSAQVPQAIVLVNNGTETRWGQTLLEWADAVCFPSTRIRFLDPDGNPGAPLQGQMIAYKGDSVDAFMLAFGQFGAVLHG